jgi:FKBP-type peptidyl-prolyl cis-trans isomerase FklB
MKLIYYLFASLTLLGFTSCSEEDDTVEEYADWQARNESYFEAQYQQHMAASSATCFVLKSYTKGDTVSVSNLKHTDCILVDVLPTDFEVEGDKTVCPIYSDDVDVHYRGSLIPSVSYASGFQFDSSYFGTFSPSIAEPVTFSVNGVIVGFATALQHMRRGDHWRVTIPYQLGYGTSTSSNIPAYSTLIFDIRMVDFEAGTNG